MTTLNPFTKSFAALRGLPAADDAMPAFMGDPSVEAGLLAIKAQVIEVSQGWPRLDAFAAALVLVIDRAIAEPSGYGLGEEEKIFSGAELRECIHSVMDIRPMPKVSSGALPNKIPAVGKFDPTVLFGLF